MFQVIRNQVRPSTDVEFFLPARCVHISDADKKLFQQKYVLTGKQVAVSNTLSEDKLTLTTTAVWIDEASTEEFITDPELKSFRDGFEKHMAETGVVRNLISKTVI